MPKTKHWQLWLVSKSKKDVREPLLSIASPSDWGFVLIYTRNRKKRVWKEINKSKEEIRKEREILPKSEMHGTSLNDKLYKIVMRCRRLMLKATYEIKYGSKPRWYYMPTIQYFIIFNWNVILLVVLDKTLWSFHP